MLWKKSIYSSAYFGRVMTCIHMNTNQMFVDFFLFSIQMGFYRIGRKIYLTYSHKNSYQVHVYNLSRNMSQSEMYICTCILIQIRQTKKKRVNYALEQDVKKDFFVRFEFLFFRRTFHVHDSFWWWTAWIQTHHLWCRLLFSTVSLCMINRISVFFKINIHESYEIIKHINCIKRIKSINNTIFRGIFDTGYCAQIDK